MENINNLNGQVPTIKFKDTKTKQVSGAICVSTPEQIRLGLLEEKLASDELGNVTIEQECDTQIVMSPDVARSLIKMLEDNLASNNL